MLESSFCFLFSVCWPKCGFRDPFHHYLMGKQTAGWVKSQQALLLFGCPLPRGKDGDKQRRGEADKLRGLNGNDNSLGFGEIKLSNEQEGLRVVHKRRFQGSTENSSMLQYADDSFLLIEQKQTFLLSLCGWWLLETPKAAQTSAIHTPPAREFRVYY